MVTDGPETGALHVAPPLVDVRYSYPATPEPRSVDPDAESRIEGTLCHDDEPPLTLGAVGFVRSRRTVSDAPGLAGTHADVLPALSTDRNCTRVSPSALMVSALPLVGADQVVPPSVEVR